MPRKRAKHIIVKQKEIKEKKKSFKINKKTIVCISLIGIFCLVLFFNSYFNYTSGMAFNSNGDSVGTRFYLAGPDPYYNMRLCEQTLERGYYPFIGEESDALLSYPYGIKNSARPPLFNMIAVGIAKVGGFFIGEMDALGWSMLFLPAIYGALLIFPIYGIGKELFNEKVGLIAALFVPLIPVHIGAGHGSAFSLFDHDSFILLLLVCVFYFLIKSLKEKNKLKSILYAMSSGIFIGSMEMAWVTAEIIFIILIIFIFVQMFLDILRTDTKSIKNAYLPFIALTTGFLISLPYAMIKNVVIDFPFYSVVASLFICIIYYIIKKLKLPWIITIPSMFSIAGLGLLFFYLIRIGIIKLGALSAISNIIFGSGIYGEKVSLTIGEAHMFNLSQTIMSIGPVLYWIGMAGFIMFILHTHKNKWKPQNTLFITLFIVNLYFLTIAGRFINDLIPTMTILAAYFTYFLIEKIDYKKMIKSTRNVTGFRKLKVMKSYHIFGILFIIFLLLPNAYCSLDAAVPGQLKPKIFGSDHRGAWGTGLDQQRDWSAACYWLSQQDTDIENPENRPAIMSWWDYGFYTSSMSGHPTVADNFQSGIEPAANFHTAKSEKEAVSILLTLLVYHEHYVKNFESVNSTLEKHNATKLLDIMDYPKSYNTLIAPEWGNTDLKRGWGNAVYRDSVEFLSSYTDEEITMLYHDIMESTGKSIRYYGVESYDTQIFGVFSFLADKGVHGYASMEDDYFATRYVDSNTGIEYTYEEAINLSQNEIQNMNLNPAMRRKEGFFNNMFFKTYYGLTSEQGEIPQYRYPTYGLKHFVPVYISNRIVIAKYYEGARINGTVNIQGVPCAGAQVYVVDEKIEIPHDFAIVGEDGTFSLIAPAGKITLVVIIGENKIDEIVFDTTENPPITEEEAMRFVVSNRTVSFDIDAASVRGSVETNQTNLTITINSLSSNIQQSMKIVNNSYRFENILPDTYQFIVTNSSGGEIYSENKFLQNDVVYNITIIGEELNGSTEG